jgi:hypothetical protein
MDRYSATWPIIGRAAKASGDPAIDALYPKNLEALLTQAIIDAEYTVVGVTVQGGVHGRALPGI